MVKYFDYTCEACRDMHEELDILLEKYDGQLAVIVLPTPLNKSILSDLRFSTNGYLKIPMFLRKLQRQWLQG